MRAGKKLDTHDGALTAKEAGVNAVESVATEITVSVAVGGAEVVLGDALGAEGRLDATMVVQGLEVDTVPVGL